MTNVATRLPQDSGPQDSGPQDPSLQSLGIAGLDEVLQGGVRPNRLYLVEGIPGTGKTTLGMQWLMAGVEAGEFGVFVSLTETRDELEDLARSHGWGLDKITICEAVVPEEGLNAEGPSVVFSAADMELTETTRHMMELVEQLHPQRVVVDSLSEMRVLAQNPYRHRQQVVALKRFFRKHHCTVLMLDDSAPEKLDLHLASAAHGVIQLQQMAPEYGPDRRRLRIAKMRAVDYMLGFHDYVIRRGGLQVFPRLTAASFPAEFEPGVLKSGIPELDQLLGGGPPKGTSMLLLGPAGTGKSTITQQFAVAAASRGEDAVIFTFEETVETILSRSDGMHLGLRPYVESGRIKINRMDPGQISPNEFSTWVRNSVEGKDGISLVVIDSLNSYMRVMPEERFLMIYLHELITFLGTHGVVTLLIATQRGLLGADIEAPVEATYLADNALLLRFFEAAGEIKLSLAATKMRSAVHERTIREIRFGSNGISIGAPLYEFQGVLTGQPTFRGEPLSLLGKP